MYPDKHGSDWIEFDSMINVRPSHGNRSRSVEDEGLRRRMYAVVARWRHRDRGAWNDVKSPSSEHSSCST